MCQSSMRRSDTVILMKVTALGMLMITIVIGFVYLFQYLSSFPSPNGKSAKHSEIICC